MGLERRHVTPDQSQRAKCNASRTSYPGGDFAEDQQAEDSCLRRCQGSQTTPLPRECGSVRSFLGAPVVNLRPKLQSTSDLSSKSRAGRAPHTLSTLTGCQRRVGKGSYAGALPQESLYKLSTKECWRGTSLLHITVGAVWERHKSAHSSVPRPYLATLAVLLETQAFVP